MAFVSPQREKMMRVFTRMGKSCRQKTSGERFRFGPLPYTHQRNDFPLIPSI